MAGAKTVFLGKRGKVHGPFSKAEIESMRLTGEIEAYTYLWDGKYWRNLDPVPPAPTPEAREANTERRSVSLEELEALCHDEQSVVSGTLRHLTDGGCEFHSHDESASPRLGVGSALVMNVVHLPTNRVMTIRASLAEVERQAGAWIYRVRWARRPSF